MHMQVHKKKTQTRGRGDYLFQPDQSKQFAHQRTYGNAYFFFSFRKVVSQMDVAISCPQATLVRVYPERYK